MKLKEGASSNIRIFLTLNLLEPEINRLRLSFLPITLSLCPNLFIMYFRQVLKLRKYGVNLK